MKCVVWRCDDEESGCETASERTRNNRRADRWKLKITSLSFDYKGVIYRSNDNKFIKTELVCAREPRYLCLVAKEICNRYERSELVWWWRRREEKINFRSLI